MEKRLHCVRFLNFCWIIIKRHSGGRWLNIKRIESESVGEVKHYSYRAGVIMNNQNHNPKKVFFVKRIIFNLLFFLSYWYKNGILHIFHRIP